MAYTTEILIWQSYEIEVRYDLDPFNMVSHTGEAMSHIEIRTIKPEKAPLPITETNYRPHFTPKGSLPAISGEILESQLLKWERI